MATTYTRPDVYIERQSNAATPIQILGTSTGAMVGVTRRGIKGEAVLVTSWPDFIAKFARGLDTPFLADSDLVYAVYGFFQNGGGALYVVRAASDAAAAAKAKVPATTGPEVSAKGEGTWANSTSETTGLYVIVEANGDAFDVTVKLNGEIVEKFVGLNSTAGDAKNYETVINGQSEYIEITATGTLVASAGVSLTGGDDGIADIADQDFLDGLDALAGIDDINIIAIPGQTSSTVANGLLDWCSTRGDVFPIIDLPAGNTADETKTAKELLDGPGAAYAPWGHVLDPLDKYTPRLCPPSGHVMGIYARTDSERGVHKAPAGIEADVRGFLDLESAFSPAEVGILNEAGVNCIISKKNYGIVVWGARLITPDSDRVYVSDLRLDMLIEESLYNGTAWVVFEPSDEILWAKASAQVYSFLFNLWDRKALKGTKPSEAFAIKCDAENNPPEVQDQGMVIMDIAYAKKKPGEFFVVRISQKNDVK